MFQGRDLHTRLWVLPVGVYLPQAQGRDLPHADMAFGAAISLYFRRGPCYTERIFYEQGVLYESSFPFEGTYLRAPFSFFFFNC
jgi:hypothetical protein